MSFIVIFCILATLAAVHNGQLFGHTFSSTHTDPTETSVGDSKVIDTSEIGKEIIGYGGPVPLRIHITDGHIDSIQPLPNNETASFLRRVVNSGLTHAWDGKSIEEAVGMNVDAVSGATFTSRAIIENVRAGARFAVGNTDDSPTSSDKKSGARPAIVLAVILAGAILPLFIRNRTYRTIQQILNVAVLGFWAGTFLDYAMMLNFFANGISFTIASAITVLLLVIGMIYPLFGKGAYYCAWICPFGSVQELAGHLSKKKLHPGAHTVRILERFRKALWVVLILMLYAGVGAEWIDYEIFTAFVIGSAPWIVIAAGAAFIILSLFIPRPFCRFVCPTGSLLKEI